MAEPTYLDTTRASYDTVAVDYHELLRDSLAGSPLDRAMLGAFADRVRADDIGPVVELGCGPGRVTAHLHALGLDACGIDLSPGMVAVARRAVARRAVARRAVAARRAVET
ncbi:methyltransferase domain-containing protein [Streptomyces sp. NPDC059994]|uniref:methyltransferase domain-containing protein n=1 Tax=Streptomyces sp. NPDC059994 TaxID=3347029 RepID=UPI0036869134